MPRLPFVMVAVALATIPALARADGLVLESYAGPRPADADRLFGPVAAELASRRFLTRDSAVTAINEHFGPAVTAAAPATLLAASAAVAKGYEAYIDGDCRAATGLLEPAIQQITSHPADARERKLRDDHFRALVVLAACHELEKAGEAAVAAMAEVIRTFPDRPVTTAEFPPRVANLYHSVKRTLAKSGYGTLDVKADDTAALIYVNERFVGAGAVALTDLVPGRYRVFAEAGSVRGRLHIVTVNAGSATRIELPWRLESRLRTVPTAGLAFDTDAARTRDESAVAVTVAREIGASSVVVLSLGEVDGHRAISGFVVDVATATIQRRGAMAVEPLEPPEAKLRLLGRYLAGEDVRDPLLDTGRGAVAGRGDGEPRARSKRKIIGLSIAGAGVVAAGVGAYFGVRTFQLHSDADAECDDAWACTPEGDKLEDRAHTSATLSNAFLAAGAVAAATGVVLWLTAPSEEDLRVAPVATPDGAAVTIGGRF
jgi:hypothetical protein